MNRPLIAALGAAVLSVALAGCGSAAGKAVPSPPDVPSPASESPASAAPSPGPADEGGIALGGDELPPGWPEGLPAYQGGTLLSAVVTEDGRNVNASWASTESADSAWAAMDAALRDAGLVPVAETGAESMLIEDETQRNDVYVGAGLEANLVVINGDQATVLLNASLL
jgi:hypothetical protein